MPGREIVPTRIALLELLDERRFVREGYDLLDERRMLLAARMLRGLDDLELQRADLARRWEHLMLRLAEALRVHGLNELEVWPPRTFATDVEYRFESALGVDVSSAAATATTGPPAWPPAADSPTIDACVEAVRLLAVEAVSAAALETAMLRLADEYRRTERRARAIENVLLPELDADLRSIELALESLEQEEVVRVHSLRAHA